MCCYVSIFPDYFLIFKCIKNTHITGYAMRKYRKIIHDKMQKLPTWLYNKYATNMNKD